MKKFALTSLLLLILACPAVAEVKVYFSPYEDCQRQFVDMIDSAKHSIKISCFGLTNEEIYKALQNAVTRGVDILICEDKMQSSAKRDKRDDMKESGMDVVVKPIHTLEHNKMMVVDSRQAIVGSWNLSGNAQAQDNSIVVFEDEPLIATEISRAINRIAQRDRTAEKNL